MTHNKIKRALISVYDKTGIVDFARALHEEFSIEIISTGGTAKVLRESGIPVTLIEDITGFPELLDGRVKTLHPKIHAAILADRDNPDHMRQLAEHGIQPIDMVVVNLYPFEKTVADPNCTFEQAMEMIDIGGVALLRAAAKNYPHVFVFSMHRYDYILDTLRGDVGADDRDREYVAAVGALLDTARYDVAISSWMSSREVQNDVIPHKFYEFESWGPIRYGENPHQQAELLDDTDNSGGPTLATADVHTDCQSEMSFTNYLDADAALGLCSELTQALSTGQSKSDPDPSANSCKSVPHESNSEPVDDRLKSDTIKEKVARKQFAFVFVKHTNACGIGVSADFIEAYRLAYLGDPNAAMGGVLAFNHTVDLPLAKVVMGSLDRWGRAVGASAFFLEIWLADDFEDEALEFIRNSKPWGKRVRILTTFGMDTPLNSEWMELRSIAGAVLVQTHDLIGLNVDQWKVVTKRTPTESEMSDLRLAWLIAKHTKSNAISICKDGMLIGNGAGQMSRVMSCRIATWLANENGHADKLPGSVAASDGFFPFADGPNLLLDAGVTAIIQPGGSKRDAEVIAACDARNAAMIFTGTRHFRH